MAIADRINEMYTHIGDVYDTITNVDLPTNKNIQNIPQTIKDSYLEIMNNGIDTIWNNWEKVTGSGTSISLSPTLKAPMRNNLKGNTSQTGTPTPTSPIPVNVVSGDNEIHIIGRNFANIRDTLITTAIKGLTFVYNQNGSFSYSGTLTNHTYLTFTNRFYNKLEAGAYTISIDKTIDYRLIWNMTYEDGTTDYYTLQPGSKSRTITFSKNIVSYYFDFTGLTTGTTYNDTLKLMIERGNQVTDFEPYQGNTYNIDLPVENLWHLDNATVNGVTLTNNADGSITLNGTCTSTSQFRTMFDTSLSNDTYTLGFVSSMALNTGSLFVRTRNSSGTLAQNIDVKATSANQTITSDIKYLDLTIINGVTYNNVNLKIQLEKGSKANSYTPYGTTPIELCKIGDYQDYFAKSDGSNLFNYNLFETFTTTIQYVSINLKPNTKYTMSSNIPITSGVGTNLFFMKDGETASTSTNGVRPDTPVTLTTDSTGVVKVGYRTGTGVSANPKTDYWYMINEGSTALPYQPYGVGKWYLHKEIGKVVLNGSENIWVTTGNNVYATNENFINISTKNNARLSFSNYYIFNPVINNVTSTIANGEYALQHGVTATGRIFLKNTNISSVDDFKTWLSTHNTSVYYVLATPTTTEITYQPLIDQLNALEQAKSKENQTNISQINNDLGFIISASALKKGV